METINSDSRRLGRWGEEQAAKYLRLRGYSVLEMNYSCRLGEIDIIARRGRYIVFAEVKLRKDAAFAEAKEFVTAAKQRRIVATAQMYLSTKGIELQPRFDVLEVYAPKGMDGRAKIIHTENAFGVDEF